MDVDQAGLRVSAGLPRRGVVIMARKVAFSSRKATLAAMNETNCYWWDSY